MVVMMRDLSENCRTVEERAPSAARKWTTIGVPLILSSHGHPALSHPRYSIAHVNNVLHVPAGGCWRARTSLCALPRQELYTPAMAEEEAKDSMLEPWPMKSKYRIGDVLGEGTFGVVYAAEVVATGQQVVVKRIRDESSHGRPSGVPATALREVSVLRELRHENVVR